MNHFEDQEEPEDRVKTRYQDYAGNTIRSWYVIEKLSAAGYHYKVRCKCNREYIRNITTILKGRSSQCFRCTRKTTYFYKK